MQGRNLIMIGIAAIVALFAVIIANAYFSGVEERQAKSVVQQNLVRIVVATRPLEFGTKLAAENIKLQAWPVDSVPEGSFRSFDEILKGGRVALRPIVVGEPILASKVSGTDGRAVLAANLPQDMRAISIPISAVAGVAGFVRPGDVVDVLLTRKIPGDGAAGDDLMTSVVLENVPVLAIDQIANESDTAPKVGGTATVQVDIVNAQKLVLAQRVGSLSLALRNVENQMREGVRIVTARDLPGRGMYIPARRQAVAAPLVMPQGQLLPGLPVRPSGPSMTVFRGTAPTQYEVRRQGRGW